ncbi:DNA translocase FtsK [Drosophila innubila]|uniref:DNA translocase FtsK n=1 Tax=Drosophila innubila TaxID=198719 RepID=UPI00148D4F2C|nr:DNA translocase FtsK [Drosophila innubila]
MVPQFLTLLTLCTAELGYQYQQPGTNFGYESDASLAINHGSHQSSDHYQDHADFHKHFYAFEAPYDSSEEADLVEHKLSANSQKNLQVVFIKAPENKAVQGALNALVKQTSEDKTAIYVLNKQTDPNELASKITALQAQRKHKPQVHFVKYRTDAEAAHAQQHIQAQYGGATGQGLQPLSPPSLGYSQQAQLPLAPQGYFPPELPQQPEFPQQAQAPPQGYYPPELPSSGYSQQPELPHATQGYYPPESSQLLPTPHPSYANYATSYQGYNNVKDQEQVELPALPLAQQQLASSPYDLDARTARSRRIDFRVNERHRSDGRMVFPTDTPAKRYLPVQRRRKRALF